MGIGAVLTACGSSDGADSSSEHAGANSRLDAVKTGSRCGDGELPDVPPFPPEATRAGSDAIAKDDDSISAFATRIEDVDYGEFVDARWMDEEQALGPAEGNSNNVVSLGEGGRITLSFAAPIADGDGPDLCVFENSFSDQFLELAFVEVASNEDVFVRFSAVSFVTDPVDGYGTLDPTLIAGFAGKYRQGYCSPFDLGLLASRPEVESGELDLSRIKYVRLVDVRGDGTENDCHGRPIYDPFPTSQSSGFDLDAIGVL
jgi:hypothetical protein